MYVVKSDEDRKYPLLRASVIPAVFVFVLWLIKSAEVFYHLQLVEFGILPRTISGLIGIVTAPLVHESYNHLINNSIPLIVLGTAIAYSYKEVKWKIFFWTWFMTNLWVWTAARNAYYASRPPQILQIHPDHALTERRFYSIPFGVIEVQTDISNSA